MEMEEEGILWLLCWFIPCLQPNRDMPILITAKISVKNKFSATISS